MKIKKIGMRTIKTAFAVFLTMIIAELINIKSPFFVGVATIMSMESSVSASFISGRNRMYGTLLGGIIALLFSLITPINPFFIGVGIIIIIHTCNMFGWRESVKISTIVFLSILVNYEEGSRLIYAFYRTLDTLVGLIIGTLINYFILPNNVVNNINESISNMYSQIKNMLEIIIWKEEHIELEALRKNLFSMEKECDTLKNETKLNLCKNNNCFNFEYIFELFEHTYNHLSIITSIENSSYIDDINNKSLKCLFNKEVPPHFDIKSNNNLDLVYNYHLEKILQLLSDINNLFSLYTK
ncbi:aromatic acid exporter family protein [Anaerophilus nitritogenes]|uniref:aromatic acid exporter family protein n=1 Tax=Anaerophilus nitritogenes TaxID=2498136 RepID=UPI00101C3628|nr:aromatic acid exporter family protein [Anaerophilus nitritogenes]